jgi:uncharacterized membrane protein YciS (DUF1049 family)
MSEQNFANHAKFVPPFHFFAMPLFAVNIGWSISRLVKRGFSFETIFGVLMAFALIVLFFFARLFALKVQDRVIRLEEKLRYEKLLPADLQSRFGDFSIDQIVSLRFASDAELPGLARKVLDEKLTDRKTIKQMVKTWKADDLRA